MAVPEFLVRKLYVPGSLAELEEGFAFVLRNTFAPATVQSLALEVDGTLVPPAAVSLTRVGGLPMTTSNLPAFMISENSASQSNALMRYISSVSNISICWPCCV